MSRNPFRSSKSGRAQVTPRRRGFSALSEFEIVPDSDPLMADEFLVVPLGWPDDDIVPDSDPPYSAENQLVVPLGWPPHTTTSASSMETLDRNMNASSRAFAPPRREYVPIRSASSPERLIENVETLCTFGPDSIVVSFRDDAELFPVYDHTQDEAGSELDEVIMDEIHASDDAEVCGNQGDPTSADERECRERMEDEMLLEEVMREALSPFERQYREWDHDHLDPVAVPRNEGDPRSTASEDDREEIARWRACVTGGGTASRGAIPPAQTEILSRSHSPGTSSSFEEAQRPPWFRLTRTVRFLTPAQSSELSDEIMPATHPDWPESPGIFRRIEKRLREQNRLSPSIEPL